MGITLGHLLMGFFFISQCAWMGLFVWLGEGHYVLGSLRLLSNLIQIFNFFLAYEPVFSLQVNRVVGCYGGWWSATHKRSLDAKPCTVCPA